MEKKVFISIPTSVDEVQNREKADLVKAALSRKGYAPVSPYDIHFGKDPTPADIVAYRLRCMLNCDAVCLCHPNDSLECKIEEEAAYRAIRYATTRLENVIYDKPDEQ